MNRLLTIAQRWWIETSVHSYFSFADFHDILLRFAVLDGNALNVESKFPLQLCLFLKRHLYSKFPGDICGPQRKIPSVFIGFLNLLYCNHQVNISTCPDPSPAVFFLNLLLINWVRFGQMFIEIKCVSHLVISGWRSRWYVYSVKHQDKDV